jgi:hypothetical protein
MYNMVMYYYVLIVFSLRQESFKLILATDAFKGGSVTTQFPARVFFFGYWSCKVPRIVPFGCFRSRRWSSCFVMVLLPG